MDAKVTSAADEIKTIAARHNIVFERTAIDDDCDAITRLSDDVVVMDDIENLLIAIRRARVHDGTALTRLHARYFEERKNAKADAA